MNGMTKYANEKFENLRDKGFNFHTKRHTFVYRQTLYNVHTKQNKND